MDEDTLHSRITRRVRTTVPATIRRALGLEPGDRLVWRIADGHVTVRLASVPQSDPFATLSEWDSAADRATYDRL
jgi:AbrB family looped-hinge helix DNA binding protein